jgi:uncharacterized protein
MRTNNPYVFYIGHPAHYYASKALADELSERHKKILFVVRAKDIVLDLMKNCPYETVYVSKKERGKSKTAMILGVLKREVLLFFLALKRRPAMFVGTDIAITHIGKLFRIPAIILNEDDEHVQPWLAKYGIKYSSATLSPSSCRYEKFKNKVVFYEGFHKMLYLAPDQFKIRFDEYEPSASLKKPYFLMRFSALSAHHDDNIGGINDHLASQIISKLEKFGNVYISSERPLSSSLEKYRLKVDPKDIHYHLFNAEMLISDSQSMSVEAAILGTPSIRFSSFSGKIGVLEELEHKYNLTFGISDKNTSGLFDKIDELLKNNDRKTEFKRKQIKMLESKINVLEFFTWFILNFPESKAESLLKSKLGGRVV